MSSSNASSSDDAQRSERIVSGHLRPGYCADNSAIGARSAQELREPRGGAAEESPVHAEQHEREQRIAAYRCHSMRAGLGGPPRRANSSTIEPMDHADRRHPRREHASARIRSWARVIEVAAIRTAAYSSGERKLSWQFLQAPPTSLERRVHGVDILGLRRGDQLRRAIGEHLLRGRRNLRAWSRSPAARGFCLPRDPMPFGNHCSDRSMPSAPRRRLFCSAAKSARSAFDWSRTDLKAVAQVFVMLVPHFLRLRGRGGHARPRPIDATPRQEPATIKEQFAGHLNTHTSLNWAGDLYKRF